jgi:polyether ionophore transport system permease protein
MRRSIFLRTLWSFRVAILGWGVGVGILMFIVVAAFDTAIGATPPSTKEEFLLAFQSIGWLWDYPGAVASTGGYATAKYSIILMLVSIWALLAGSRILRGQEEIGQLDMLLSLPRSRARVVFEKLSALFVALLLIGAIIGLFTYGGEARITSIKFSFADAMFEGLMVSLLAASFAGLSVLISQFTRRRNTAAGITGALFALSIVLNSVSLISPAYDWVGKLSPVYYFRISKPLVADYGMNWGAAAVLLGMALVFSGVGTALFLRRDVGSVIPVAPEGVSIPGLRTAAPQSGWSLRSLLARAVALEAPRALWWAVGLGFFYFIFTFITRQIQLNLIDSFKGTAYESIIKALAGGQNATGNAFFLSLLMEFIPLLITAMAVTQVNGWERVEAEGQLDLVLATPQTRAKAILTRMGAAAAGQVLVLAVTFVAILISSAIAGLTLDIGKLAQATLGALPWGLVVLSAGYLLATWIRRALLTTVLSLALAISYGIGLAADAAGWPEWVKNLSIYSYYGNPLLTGLNWTAFGVLMGVSVLFTAVAVWGFAAKDIGRWAFLPNLGWRFGRRRRRQAAVAS